MIKNIPKTIHAWCMYDWANSVYSLTITTAVFPEYFLSVTNNSNNNNVLFLGWELNNAVLYSYALSSVFLLAAILSPLLSGIADYSGNKKTFMKFFCYLGSLSCMGLYWFELDTLELGVLCFVMAGLGYSGSIVFYNSFLPEITSDDNADRVSARGFAYGYVGSVLLLIINILMIMKSEWFGLDGNATMPARVSFLTVGIWWLGFAQFTFFNLEDTSLKRKFDWSIIKSGFERLRKVWHEVSKQKLLKNFLFGFAFYNMGVQTVMYMATIFGKDQLKLETSSLILVILLIQLIAIGGAQLFAKLSWILGNTKTLIVLVVIWITVCVIAYFVKDATQFYLLSVLVGLVMGGVQSMSRSTYSKLIPDNAHDHASYFSFFDVIDKLSTFLGTLSFGMIAQISGGMRNSTLALTAFFIFSLWFLAKIPSQRTYNIKA